MTKEKTITVWLKRIFSIQTLSILISLLATYYAYRGFIDSRLPQATILLPSLIGEKDEITFTDASDVSHYWYLGFHEIPPVSINNGSMGGTDNIILFPRITNSNSKSINHFSAEIYIYWDDCLESIFNRKESVINTKYFNILSKDARSMELSYKSDYLAPNSDLPYPFSTLYLFEASETIATKGGNLNLVYVINYEGAEKVTTFKYTAKFYYDDSFTDKFISNARYRFYKNEIFSNYVGEQYFNDGEWVLIDKNCIYRNIRHLTPTEFESMGAFSINELQEE